MKNLVKQISILFILVLSVHEGYCQNNYATNISTTVTDEQKLFVNFDIVANDGSKYFHVVLVLNYEGEQIIPNPNNLFGDFGHVITPGDKIIYWDFGGEFKKDINRMKVQVLAYKENVPEARFLSSPVGGNFFAPAKYNLQTIPSIATGTNGILEMSVPALKTIRSKKILLMYLKVKGGTPFH